MADDAKQRDIPALPPDVMPRILKSLPTDARARCRAVRKDFRDMVDALDDASTLLDLSWVNGTSCTVNDAALAAAARPLAGTLQVLQLTGCEELSHAAIYAVVTANASTLREVRVGFCNTAMCLVETTPAAAPPPLQDKQPIHFDSLPNLEIFELSLTCSWYALADGMNSRHPYLRARQLVISAELEVYRSVELRARHAALAARPAHCADGPPMLLSSDGFDLQTFIDALRSGAMLSNLRWLAICDVALTGNTPAETVLLFEALASVTTLRYLRTDYKEGALDEPAVAQALAALLAARKLTERGSDETVTTPRTRCWMRAPS